MNFTFENPPGQDSGRALGAYRPTSVAGGDARKAVLVFDMNGGEYRIEGNDSWKNRSKKVDEFHRTGSTGALPSRCEVHVVTTP